MKSILVVALAISAFSMSSIYAVESEYDSDGRPWFVKYFKTGRVKEITGLKIPPGWRWSKNSHFLDIHPVLEELPVDFDLRTLHPTGKLQPIKRQRCGDCWAHSVLAVLETNWALKYPTQPLEIYAQQEFISTCPKTGGGCNGGYFDAFDYVSGKTGPGAPMEEDLPYKGYTTSCNHQVTKKPRAASWTYVGARENLRGPSIQQMKQALVSYGSLSVTVHAFSWEGSEIYKNCYAGSINHMVNIEGWHDFATQAEKDKYGADGYWIMRNSWGESFGDRGYAKVVYADRSGRKCNNLGSVAAVAVVN
ncbi:MAG: hypothetical protein HY537_15740 [Deltaproteobacteria bacterium]|nr:hypothetical protein [Deltaproteobacteria bacterium]